MFAKVRHSIKNKTYCNKVVKNNTRGKIIAVTCLTVMSVCVSYKLYCTWFNLTTWQLLYTPPGSDKCRFETLPTFVKTRQNCLKIISIRGELIESVPECYVDQEMYDVAVTQGNLGIGMVPLEFRSAEIYAHALYYRHGSLWEIIPPNHQTIIPLNLQTQDLFNQIVAIKPQILNLVPDKFVNSSLFKNNPALIAFIPDSNANFAYITNMYTDSIDLAIYKKICQRLVRKQLHNLPTEYTNKTELVSKLETYLAENDILADFPSEILNQFGPDEFDGLLLTGKQFKFYFPHRFYVKLTKHSNIHNGFEFAEGVMDDTTNFNSYSFTDSGIFGTEFPKQWEEKYECDSLHCNLYDVLFLDNSIIKMVGSDFDPTKIKFNIAKFKNFRKYIPRDNTID